MGLRGRCGPIWVVAVFAATLTACGGGSAETAPGATEAGRPATTQAAAAPGVSLEDFAAELEGLRVLLRIPGMSAAVVEDQEVVWAQGFGFADVAAAVPATPDTSYHLASVTKPIAATMLMQLVEEGAVALDDPVADYGVAVESDGVVEVGHLLTHTSAGRPGTVHDYDGNRYAELGQVAEAATGESFRALMFDRIIAPTGMTHSAGNAPGCNEAADAAAAEEWGEAVRAGMATPYQLDQAYEVVPSVWPGGYSPAAGLIASVADVAAFDIALDRGELVDPATVDRMWEPRIATDPSVEGASYGLGWYTQDHGGTQLVWHSGRWPPSVSALYLKVPDLGLSFIVLANTPNLTTPFPLGNGDVLGSALALTFYREFVFPRVGSGDLPEVDWSADDAEVVATLEAVTEPAARDLLGRELWARRQAVFSVGLTDEADRLLRIHRTVFTEQRGLSDYLGSAADTPVLAGGVELDPAVLAEYTGSFVVDPAASTWPAELGDPPARVEIIVERGMLAACAGDAPFSVVVPLGDDRFRTVGGPSGTFEFTAARGVDGVMRLVADVAPGVRLVFVADG